MAETKLRAERRIGELLGETVEAHRPKLSHDGTVTTLPDGVTRDQSSRYQSIAAMPEPDFERHVVEY